MAEPTEKSKDEKPTGPPKVTIKVNDVSPADKSAPEPSAKPIIVTNRPMIKDPMVKEEDPEPETAPKQPVKHELKLLATTDAAPKDAPADEEPKAPRPTEEVPAEP